MLNTDIHETTIQEDANKLRQGWRKVRFGDVVRNVQVNVEPDESGLERYVAGEHMETDNLHIRQWGIIGDGYLGPAFHRKFTTGQVLYGSRRTYLRKVAIAEFEGICANTTFTLEANKSELLPELLPFILQTEAFTDHSIKQSRGSVNPYVNWKDLEWYEFALPPKDEQRRIAEILWAADNSLQGQKNLLGSLIVIRQLLIDQIIFSDSQPASFVVLKDICKMQNGRSFLSEEYGNEGIRLLRPGNLGSDGYFYWDSDNTKFLPREYLDIASEYLVKPNDVVINLTAQSLEDGFMGRVCIAKGIDVALLNQRIGRFICDKAILPEYLYRCLQTTLFRELVETNCEGSKIKHLYWRHLENFSIPLLPLEKQMQIVERLLTIDTALAKAKKSLNNTIFFRNSLTNTLLLV